MGSQGNRLRGFSLVEIMIVVLIIGLLAAIAIPAYLNSRTKSQATALANDFRTYAAAFQIYATEKGGWPKDVYRATIPAGMEGSLPKFTLPSVVEGNWDWDQGSVGFKAAITLIDSNITQRTALRLDEIMDNGDLGSGGMVQDGNKVIYILER